ncbi:CIC11C00000003855 [Sungouiella intermedia]|uniref:2-dehydropantolactone reductase n=1 Tax=Sungouiella intermedia TaxID=45354 RepID=A0A1L0BTI8_9ASCO|nr:CIC11C00000003855 [[Candida] intermedia]
MATNISRSQKTYTLNTSKTIPAIGLGTWKSSDEDVYKAVLAAIETGYRHIDTAACYGNEKPIGDAIRDSKIPRDQLFVTTKVWCTDHTRVKQALDTSLEKLGLDYVDLYLMHWPVPLNPNGNHPNFPTLENGKRDILKDWDFIKTYQQLQDVLTTSKTKAIGVSNLTITNLKKLLEAPGVTVVPATNQVELHPYLPQPKLVQFCKDNGIVVEAYSPLGSTDSPLLLDEIVADIAKKNNVSPATILISWALWRGTVVLPKSVTPSRISSNFEVIELSDEDGKQLNDLWSIRGVSRLVQPDWSPLVVFDSDE